MNAIPNSMNISSFICRCCSMQFNERHRKRCAWVRLELWFNSENGDSFIQKPGQGSSLDCRYKKSFTSSQLSCNLFLIWFLSNNNNNDYNGTREKSKQLNLNWSHKARDIRDSSIMHNAPFKFSSFVYWNKKRSRRKRSNKTYMSLNNESKVHLNFSLRCQTCQRISRISRLKKWEFSF